MSGSVQEVPPLVGSQAQPYDAVEWMSLLFLVLYGCVYVWGSKTSKEIAKQMARVYRDTCRLQFAAFGISSRSPSTSQSELVHVSSDGCSDYIMYASGRLNVTSAVLTLELWKRQNLFSHLSSLLNNPKEFVKIQFLLDLPSSVPVVCLIASADSIAKDLRSELEDVEKFAALVPGSKLPEADRPLSVFTDARDVVQKKLATPAFVSRVAAVSRQTSFAFYLSDLFLSQKRNICELRVWSRRVDSLLADLPLLVDAALLLIDQQARLHMPSDLAKQLTARREEYSRSVDESEPRQQQKPTRAEERTHKSH